MSNYDEYWIRTNCGIKFHLLDPRPEEIDIQDIAWALSNVCRWGGHTKFFYSVAQHSLFVASLAPQPYKLTALMHDASEAYLGDLVAPLKHSPVGKIYKQTEHNLMTVIAEKYGLIWPLPDVVHHLDMVALATEAEQLMDDNMLEWDVRPADPLPRNDFYLRGQTREAVCEQFLCTFSLLMQQKADQDERDRRITCYK